MKDITIDTLELSNWRAQNRKITFSEKTEIEGRNKSGKSTTKDALLWLLTGYDSEDRFNHQLFDTKTEYTYENNIPAYVEASFTIDSITYTLRRCARQGWVRKRNSETYEKKTTDDYSFFIDGVEVSSGDYTRFVESSFCPVQHLKFILNISYYLSLDWKELRKVFSDIIGDIQMSDYEGDFSEIEDMLKRYQSLDAIKDMLQSKRKPIKVLVGDRNNPGTLQPEIDALTANLPDISAVGKYEEKAASIRQRMAEIDSLMAGTADSIAPMMKRRNEQVAAISRARNDLEKARAEYDSRQYAKEREIISRISEAERKNNTRLALMKKQEQDRAEINRQIEILKESVKARHERRMELLAKNKEVKSRVFSATRCAYCGQELPDDMLEDARRKFNEETEKEHESIVREGKANNEEMAVLTNRIEALEQELQSEPSVPEEISTASLQNELDLARAARVPFENTDEYRSGMAAIKEMEDALGDESASGPDTSALREEKSALSQELIECGKVIGRKSEYARMTAEIDRKRTELSRNISELAEIERLMSRAEEMEKQKMDIIRKRVKHLFDVCDIEMEVRKKDGTMTPACNISVDGVPASVLNSAAKIEAGIDISNAFCRHNGVWMPLVIDDMESVDPDKELNIYARQEIKLTRKSCDFTVINL